LEFSIDTDSGRETHHVNALVVASGVFSAPALPSDYTLPTTGVSHAATYRGPGKFANLRVLVVGSAFSGADIAAEISEVAAETVILVRRPTWYLPRLIPDGRGRSIPLDLLFYSRRGAAESKLKDPIQSIRDRHKYFASIVGNQGLLDPKLEVLDDGVSAPIVVSDVFPAAVRNRRVRVATPADIDLPAMLWRDAGRKVTFDAVIYATGYRPALNFLDSRTLKAVGYDPTDELQPILLAKTVFPREDGLKLGFVGMYRGPYFATIELQARWLCANLAGAVPMLSSEELNTAIDQEKSIRGERPRPQFPHSDYVTMCDDIATRIGVLPDLSDSNPLHHSLYNGPLLAAHFRLDGRHAKRKVAADMIDSVAQFLRGTSV
jgi:dimethylaniline monooxygenase (N-oxide forming)